MKKKGFPIAIGMLAFAPTLLFGINAVTARVRATEAQVNPTKPTPSGLTGSYLGVSVTTTQALDFGQQWFRQGSTPTGWFVDQAVQAVKSQQTTQNRPKDQATDHKDFQGRLDLGASPISIRGKVSVSPEVNVIQPIVSYDLAIAPNANLYAGAGYSFVSPNSGTTSIGNRDSFVVVTGAEAAVSKGIVIYGDAQFRMNTPNSQDNSGVKLQVGAGYRF